MVINETFLFFINETSCGKLGIRLFGFGKVLLIACSLEQNPHQ